MKHFIFCALLLCACWAQAASQTTSPHTLEEAGLQDVAQSGLNVFFDIRYATPDNFTKQQIYDSPRCYLHKEAVEGLRKALKLAAQEKEPFTFCLWDCYRPLAAQKKLWTAVPNASYVAPPKKGSRHNRGMAVDLTPCDFQGRPLPMPTGFDSFTVQAHMDFDDLPPDVLARRETLKKIMTRAGFTYTRTEWWHFDKTGWKTKPVLDIPLPAQ